MSESFSLRPATVEDLESIVQIEERVQKAPWSIDNFRQEILQPISLFLVLSDDENHSTIIAYLVARLVGDECQILNVAVDLPYRNQGFGREMLRKMLTLADQNGILRIFLEVRKSNFAAIQLYQSVQFSITHIRKNFYSDGEDAYQMNLNLSEIERF